MPDMRPHELQVWIKAMDLPEIRALIRVAKAAREVVNEVSADPYTTPTVQPLADALDVLEAMIRVQEL